MKSKLQKILFLSLLLITKTIFALPIPWQTLAPGLEYIQMNSFASWPGTGIHAFRIDLQKYQLQLAFTQGNPNKLLTISDLVNVNKAVIGVNGGFFTPDLKPLGLRMDQGQIKNPLKPTVWWGVFFTRNSQAYIVPQSTFSPSKNIDFAVQSGPRLIVNGKIPPLKPGFANRTALGITQDGKIILLVTDNFPLSTTEVAEIMQAPTAKGGLNCVNALNLDGGSSTQLYAKINAFRLDVPSFAPVTDAVLVIPK